VFFANHNASTLHVTPLKQLTNDVNYLILAVETTSSYEHVIFLIPFIITHPTHYPQNYSKSLGVPQTS